MLKNRHILNGPCHCACMNALGDESVQIQSRALAVARVIKETCQVFKAPRSLLIGRSNHPHHWFLPVRMSKWFYFFLSETPSWVPSWSNKPSANPTANELAKHPHSPSSATAKTQTSIPGRHVPLSTISAGAAANGGGGEKSNMVISPVGCLFLH